VRWSSRVFSCHSATTVSLAAKLALRGVHFVQIAGNDEIMRTVVAPQGSSLDLPPTDASLLFVEKFLTQPGVQRFELECPVRSVHSVLNQVISRGIKIEHVYDY
jgi:hypothetical protein